MRDVSTIDIGILSIISTYITTLILILYEYLIGNLKNYVDVALVVGKNPYLFILNLILYMIGGYLILDNIDIDKDHVVDLLFFLIPTLNILVAFLYLVTILGGEGILVFSSEVHFILMYNLLLYVIGIALSLRKLKISKEAKIVLGYAALLVLYIVIRVYVGVYPIIQVIILLLVIAYTLYVPRIH